MESLRRSGADEKSCIARIAVTALAHNLSYDVILNIAHTYAEVLRECYGTNVSQDFGIIYLYFYAHVNNTQILIVQVQCILTAPDAMSGGMAGRSDERTRF